MRQADIAYFAGLLDGEGCIRIGSFRNSAGQLRYRAFVSIAMTDPRPIRWLTETFGGGFYTDHKKTHPEHKVAYGWSLNARAAAMLIERAYPYLKVKREQADILFHFADTLAGMGGHGGTRPISDDLLEQRRAMFLAMRAANRKGRAA